MLQQFADYSRLTVRATNGDLGTLDDCLFDDARWTIRYFVVGANMFDRKIAVSPIAVVGTDWPTREMAIRLSVEQIREGPDLLSTPEIPRTREQEYAAFHGYPAYWGGPALWAWAGAPGALAGAPPEEYVVATPPPASADVPHHQFQLRSLAELRGAHLQALDGGMGHVDDVLIERESWHVPYLRIDTSNWIGGRALLIPTANVTAVDWTARNVYVDVTRERIRASPPFDVDKPLDRTTEETLAAYYSRSVVQQARSAHR